MELLVVVAIIGTLVIAFGASFFGWRERYHAESDMKMIHGALLEAKLNAIKEKRFFFVYFPADEPYVLRVYKDTDPAPKGDGELDAATDEKFGSDIVLNNRVQILSDYREFAFTAQGWLWHAHYDEAGKRDFQIRLVQPESDVSAQADYNCLRISPPLYVSGGIWNATEEQEEGDSSLRNIAMELSGSEYVTPGKTYPLCMVK